RVLRPPLKVRRLADVVLPEDLGDLDARLPLLQDLDNLALREPRLSHGHLLDPGKSTVEVSTGRGSFAVSRSNMESATAGFARRRQRQRQTARIRFAVRPLATRATQPLRTITLRFLTPSERRRAGGSMGST